MDLERLYRGRSYFSDSTFLSMWAVPRIVIFWISLVLMLPGILQVTLSSPFLISPRVPTTTDIISVSISHILMTSISKSLYLDNSLCEFYWGVTFRWNCYVNEHAPSFFLALTIMSGLLAFIYLPGPHRYFPWGGILVAPAYIFWNTYSWNMQSVNYKKISKTRNRMGSLAMMTS